MPTALSSYLLLIKWHALSSRPWLILLFIIQIAMTAGMIIGISFLFPEINPMIARHLITGTPTLILLTMGLVTVPQIVAAGRLEGTYDFMLSLPVPRMALLAANATIYLLITIPGLIIALIIGSIYHDFSLQISPLVLPALLLISSTGTFVGYAIAIGAPRPQMAQVATQVIIFVIMFFSPVLYPVEQLPGWLATMHKVMPVQYMADLSRGTLTDIDVNLGLAFAVTGGWCIVGFMFCYIVMKKRR